MDAARANADQNQIARRGTFLEDLVRHTRDRLAQFGPLKQDSLFLGHKKTPPDYREGLRVEAICRTTSVMLPFSISQDRIKRLSVVDIARVQQSQEKHLAKAFEPDGLLVCRHSERQGMRILAVHPTAASG